MLTPGSSINKAFVLAYLHPIIHYRPTTKDALIKGVLELHNFSVPLSCSEMADVTDVTDGNVPSQTKRVQKTA